MEAQPTLAATGPTSRSPPKCLRNSEKWDEHFLNLLKFKKKNGHCLVPKNYPDNRKLSNWVFSQRRYYTDREKGIKNSLTDEHEKKLNDIGFAFKAAGNKDYQKLVQSKGIERFKSTWEKHFKDLKEYKGIHGNCLVPKVFPEHPALAGWVYVIRSMYKKRSQGVATNLTDDQVERMNSLGFIWDAKKCVEWKNREKERISWEDRYNELIAYKNQHGHTRVPKSYKNQKLAYWVKKMRSNYKKWQNGDLSMPDDRLKRLNDIDFVWQARTIQSTSPLITIAAKQTNLTSSARKPSTTFADGNSGDNSNKKWCSTTQLENSANSEPFLRSHTNDGTEKEDSDSEEEGSICLHMENTLDGIGEEEAILHSDAEELTSAVAAVSARSVSRRHGVILTSSAMADNSEPKIVSTSSILDPKGIKQIQELNFYAVDDSTSSKQLDEINKMFMAELMKSSAFFCMNERDQELLRVVEESNLSREKNQNKLDYVKNCMSKELSDISGIHISPAPSSVVEIVQRYSASMEVSAKAEFIEKRRQLCAMRKILFDRFSTPPLGSQKGSSSKKRKLQLPIRGNGNGYGRVNGCGNGYGIQFGPNSYNTSANSRTNARANVKANQPPPKSPIMAMAYNLPPSSPLPKNMVTVVAVQPPEPQSPYERTQIAASLKSVDRAPIVVSVSSTAAPSDLKEKRHSQQR